MFKNKKVLVFLLILLFTIVLLVLFNRNKKTKNTVFTQPTTGVEWNGITPGKSTKEDVEKILGRPSQTSGDTLSFKSSSEARDNQISIINNQVDIVRQMITPKDNTTTETLTKKYGDTSIVLYGPESPNGISLYIYPEKGIAYLGNSLTGNVTEVWYFPPTTLSSIKEKYAQEYSETYSPSF